MVFIWVIFLYDPRAIHRFPIFDFVQFGILLSSQMSYGVMGLWSSFSNVCILSQMSFQQNVLFSIFSAICPSADMSFQSDVFRPYVHSVFVFRLYVFWPYIRSVICFSAIYSTTTWSSYRIHSSRTHCPVDIV